MRTARSLQATRGLAAAVMLVGVAACLPDPAEKATIAVNVRAGPREFVTSDGYALRFERRLIVIGVATSSNTGGGGGSQGQIVNLDATPVALRSLRALGDRYVGVATQSASDRTPSARSVSDADLEALKVSTKGVAPNALVVQGTLEKGGETWSFDWRAPLYVAIVCRQDPYSLAPIYFETQSEHTLDVEVHFERFFATALDPTAKEPGVLHGQAFVEADADGDHQITLAEIAFVGAPSPSSSTSPSPSPGPIRSPSPRLFVDRPEELFSVALDSNPLTCRYPGAIDDPAVFR